MRVRKLLLIHPKRSIRALIKKYIFSELSDIQIHEADGSPSALDLINTAAFDVIILPGQLEQLEIADLKACQMASEENLQTPVIIISESESDHPIEELGAQNFDHIVELRKRPAELIQKINAACNPREWRKDEHNTIGKGRYPIILGQ